MAENDEDISSLEQDPTDHPTRAPTKAVPKTDPAHPSNSDLPQEGNTEGGKGQPVQNKLDDILLAEADRLIAEMEAASFADLEAHQLGKPAMHKLQIVEGVRNRLRNHSFARAFLDKGGLDQLYQFLKKLPDGSLPLSSVRKCVYEILLDLPYQEQHLKSSKIGKTRHNLGKALTSLHHSAKEIAENKKMIEHIKERWTRLSNGHRVEYNDLENFEKENKSLMQKKKKRTSASNFAELDEDNFNDSTHSSAKVKMGYNFTIRPKSLLTKREISKLEPKKTDIDKYLTKIRKMKKIV